MKDLNLEIAKKPLGILQEFKEFAMRGNVVDLAVGVVIGAAFGKIVTSMVADILTPFISLITHGGGDLKEKFISLEPAKTVDTNGVPFTTLVEAQKHGAVVAYGQFLTSVIDFVIVAFCIFLVVKLINKLHAPPPPAPPPDPTAEEKLLTEIRDLLKAKS